MYTSSMGSPMHCIVDIRCSCSKSEGALIQRGGWAGANLPRLEAPNRVPIFNTSTPGPCAYAMSQWDRDRDREGRGDYAPEAVERASICRQTQKLLGNPTRILVSAVTASKGRTALTSSRTRLSKEVSRKQTDRKEPSFELSTGFVSVHTVVQSGLRRCVHGSRESGNDNKSRRTDITPSTSRGLTGRAMCYC